MRRRRLTELFFADGGTEEDEIQALEALEAIDAARRPPPIPKIKAKRARPWAIKEKKGHDAAATHAIEDGGGGDATAAIEADPRRDAVAVAAAMTQVVRRLTASSSAKRRAALEAQIFTSATPSLVSNDSLEPAVGIRTTAAASAPPCPTAVRMESLERGYNLTEPVSETGLARFSGCQVCIGGFASRDPPSDIVPRMAHRVVEIIKGLRYLPHCCCAH
jgi:hypothetical protein